MIGTDLQAGLKLIEHGNFSVAGGGAHDGLDFAGRAVQKFGAEDVVSRNDSLQGRLDDLDRRGGEHVKIEVISGNALAQNFIKQANVFFQPDMLADLI